MLSFLSFLYTVASHTYSFQHVEQLLRSLDLDSVGIEPLSPTVIQADASPSTSSSFPNTPIESSPMMGRADDIFQSFYELNNPHNLIPSNNFEGPRSGQQKKLLNDQYWADALPISRSHITNNSISNQSSNCLSSLPGSVQDYHTTSFHPSNAGPFPIDHRRISSANSSNNWANSNVLEISEWSQISPSLGSATESENAEDPSLAFQRAHPTERNRLGSSCVQTTRHQSNSQNEVCQYYDQRKAS